MTSSPAPNLPPARRLSGMIAGLWILTFSDLNMLVNTGGRERSEAQYRALLAAAELRVLAVRPAAGSSFAVFEAVRA